MKNIFFLILFLLNSTTILFASHLNVSTFESKEEKLLQLFMETLKKNHVTPIEINDNFSKVFFKNYMIFLDKDKIFLLQSDFDEFKKFETKLDDQIKKNDLSFFYLTYARILKRKKEAKIHYTNVSKNNNDFNIEEFQPRDDIYVNYAKTSNEIKNRWRILFKAFVLDKFFENKDADKKKIYEAEKELKDEVFKIINASHYNFEMDEKTDYFSYYLTSIATSFDSHSGYLRPINKTSFDLSVSGKLVGVGIKVRDMNGILEIVEIVHGGPAWKNKKLEVSDQLLKIAENNSDLIDVVGFKIPEITKLIKGSIGTYVKLIVKKSDGKIKTIVIKRDVVEIFDSYVKSSVVEKNSNKLGIISIPKFYKDFDDDNARNLATDVAIEIELLKKEGIKGLLLDLRNNRDGLVETAIELAGLFIGKGAIAQFENADLSKQIMQSLDAKPIWDGSLVLMLNESSASATEIFAAAIQDYKRGIIVGEKRTFGKGSVQNTIDLNQLMPNVKDFDFDFGTLKVSNQKFYKITGESTQNVGVKSDLILPSIFEPKNIREEFLLNSFKPTKIAATSFIVFQNNFQNVIIASKKRISENNNYKVISTREENYKKFNNFIEKSLQIEKFEAHSLKNNKLNVSASEFLNYNNNLIFKSTESEIKSFKKNAGLEEKRLNWHNQLSKDIFIDEALNVLNDMLLDTNILNLRTN